MANVRILTEAEKEFVQSLVSSLPPVIARKEVKTYLGGIVAPQTLSNADASGEGPEVAYRIGRTVAYSTEQLVLWIVERFGVSRIRNIKSL